METCTAGAVGGPGKPTGSNPGRAPRSDPTLHDYAAYPAAQLAGADAVASTLKGYDLEALERRFWS